MISIIVPVYNVDKYIENCIQSIINQTYKNLEIILIDDGSTDKSGAICDKYSKIDNRIKVIHKINGGLSEARNVGLDIARGDYIGFVDSDDYIHPQMYELLYKNLIGTSADISIIKHIRKEEELGLGDINSKKLYSNLEAIENILKKDSGIFIASCNKLYKKEIFNGLRFTIGKIYEDFIIAPFVLYKAKKIVYTPVNLYFYRRTENSITTANFSIKNLDIIFASNNFLKFMYSINHYDLDKAIYWYIDTLFKYYYRAKKELNFSDRELKYIRKEFMQVFNIIFKSRAFTFKEKILWIIFIFNPNIYELYLNLIKDKNINI